MTVQQPAVFTRHRWTRRIGVTACAMLLLAPASAQAQRAPSTATGRRQLSLSIGDCQRRVEEAFRSEGFTINGRGQDFAFGLREPYQVGVNCLKAPDGNTWASLFVAGNGVSVAAASVQRDRLLRAIELPTSAGVGPAPAVAMNRGGSLQRLCGWSVSAVVYQEWQRLGGQNGDLGCATSDEKEAQRSPFGTAGTVVFFNKPDAAIYHITTGRYVGQVYAVYGRIGQKYSELGDTGGWLGFPIAEAALVPGGSRAVFEGGYITWNRSRGIAEAYRSSR